MAKQMGTAVANIRGEIEAQNGCNEKENDRNRKEMMSGRREVLPEQEAKHAARVKYVAPERLLRDPSPAAEPAPNHLDTDFPSIEGRRVLRPVGTRPKSWPSVSNPRLAMTWDELRDEPTRTY